eukprot:1029653-Prymnesium_polylepis.1
MHPGSSSCAVGRCVHAEMCVDTALSLCESFPRGAGAMWQPAARCTARYSWTCPGSGEGRGPRPLRCVFSRST